MTASDTSSEALARGIMAAVASRDVAAIRTLEATDVVDDFVAIGEFRGIEAVAGFFAELFAAVPDFTLEVLSVASADDTATVQWRATGTFTGGPFQGVHATGRSIDLRGCDVMTFQDGLLLHNTIYYDGLAFARQIGLLPAEGSTADRAMQAAFNAKTDLLSRVTSLRR